MPDIFTAKPDNLTVAQKVSSLPPHMTLAKHSVGLFSHYCDNPDGVKFINQEDNEAIIIFLRRHFITNIPWLFATFVLLLLPILTIALFRLSNFSLFTLPPHFLPILLSFYYLVVFNFAFVNFIVWFYHVGIVTQKRLLDLDVYNILNHQLAETNLTEIVDVSYSQRGFFQSFFDYGDIPIQTEAYKANFEFELAPKPAVVSDIITDLRPYAKGEK